MTFDHLPGTQKLEDVSTLVMTGRMQMAVREIEKCEIVCANCHAVRTYQRRHSSRDMLVREAVGRYLY